MKYKGLLILILCSIITTPCIKQIKKNDCDMYDDPRYLDCISQYVSYAVDNNIYTKSGFEKIKCKCKKLIINENKKLQR